MTVRELINQLIDMPSDEEVCLYLPEKHIDEVAGEVQGYIFHIDEVDVKDRSIVFTDWRKDDTEPAHWIESLTSATMQKIHVCSKCGFNVSRPKKPFTYCPNCGKRMIKEES